MANKKSQKSKDENYWAVFEAVIRLDFQKGPMSWKISDLARASKVSRTLIYYYFGNSKEHIMQTAIDFLGEEYFGLSLARKSLWQNGLIFESLQETRRLCQRAPFVHFFYMTRRHIDSNIGKQLREFEKRFRQKISKAYPKAKSEEIEALAAVIFGLVASPDLSDSGLNMALNIIKRNLEIETINNTSTECSS